MADAIGNAIADAVLTTFAALPAKFKPRVRPGTSREWVPLSGVVLSGSKRSFECVALATGMKCLPRDKIEYANGVTLHDSHAEVLALRAFNCFLIEECRQIASGGESGWVEASGSAASDEEETNRPFKIRDGVQVSMYCSEAPCGDASMELIMAEQDDATPWDVPPVANNGGSISDDPPMHGRGYFSQLGVVRTKPSRPDAPPTLSKSCTDKLALKQCTTVVQSVASLLLSPHNASIDIIVLPESQYVHAALDRAFGSTGRFSRLNEDVQSTWDIGYCYRPFRIITTTHEFEHSKRSGSMEGERIASNISAVWTSNVQEVLINGARQGRKQFDSRGASFLSRKSMWKAAVDVARLLGLDHDEASAWHCASYHEMKESRSLNMRRKVKEDVRRVVLHPWTLNVGDEAFGLED